MEVIYADNHLLAALKPAGIATQPHEEASDNFLDRAKQWVKKKYNKPGKVFLEPIHRLDKPVSGIVLFARTSKALSRLQEMMRQQTLHKVYYAWVETGDLEPQGTLEHYLVHGEHKAHTASAAHPEAKLARLHYTILEVNNGKSLVEIVLETGRYHQIRAQFAAIGSPVIGDTKYGSSQKWHKEGIALHHGKLEFLHPVSKEQINLDAVAYFSKGGTQSKRPR
ncbi:MAG: RNA pseudouridine synthase [Chlamydiota bacterium]